MPVNLKMEQVLIGKPPVHMEMTRIVPVEFESDRMRKRK